MVELFEKIKTILTKHPHSKSSNTLAKALASACSDKYSVSLLECSLNLDEGNKALIMSLADIVAIDGYISKAQSEALAWLGEHGYMEEIEDPILTIDRDKLVDDLYKAANVIGFYDGDTKENHLAECIESVSEAYSKGSDEALGLD